MHSPRQTNPNPAQASRTALCHTPRQTGFRRSPAWHKGRYIVGEGSSKITSGHLTRDAFLYVRQSTLHQVIKNTESTQRQYALRQRAVALGWPLERVHVIDCDLGLSGASAKDRAGFQQLVGEVGLGHAGVVLGLEVSRLARNSTDWHRLLELCAMSNTLILDEDGLYDPNDFNDRLLLGLKGTMSEAELHFLRARMRGGILSKAKRGELKVPIPVGFVYDEQSRVHIDPDVQVRQCIELLFATYRRTGSALATVKHFKNNLLDFPRRLHKGFRKGEVVWGKLQHQRVLQILHNPRYAGAYFFGRTRTIMTPNGKTQAGPTRDRSKWLTLIQGAHAGYISWEEFEDTQKRLAGAANSRGVDRRHGPPGSGCALLQGACVCGVCGRRMSVRYKVLRGHQVPVYVCQRDLVDNGDRICQSIPGSVIDEALVRLLFETMSPVNLELALAVQQEIVQRRSEVMQIRAQAVERARYEADLARQRFLRVDPNNRLVASTLESDWNEAMRRVQLAADALDEHQQKDATEVDAATRNRIASLTTDFPSVWQAENTTDQDRKRMFRLVIQDVTLTQTGKTVRMQVRFCAGAERELSATQFQPLWRAWLTRTELLAEISAMLMTHTDDEVIQMLNTRGERAGDGQLFGPKTLQRLRGHNLIPTRTMLMKQHSWFSARAMAQKLAVTYGTIVVWGQAGLLDVFRNNGTGHPLYRLQENAILPIPQRGKKLIDRRPMEKFPIQNVMAVQHEP